MARTLLTCVPEWGLQGGPLRGAVSVHDETTQRRILAQLYEAALVSALRKVGKYHEVPVHHKTQRYLLEYLERADFQSNAPLFQTSKRKSLRAALCRAPRT